MRTKPCIWGQCVGIFLLNVVLIGSLVSCGPRPGTEAMVAITADSTTENISGSALVVDLPALYIDYDTKGIAYLGSTRLTELGAAVGRDLTALDIGEEWVTRLTAANIQHVQLLNRAEGIVLLVNGTVIPSVGWNEEMLVNTARLFQALEGGASWVEALLPLTADWGVGLVVRFPLAAGAVPIPLKEEETPSEDVIAAATAITPTAQEVYLALIGVPPQLLIEVNYAADGTWVLADMNATAWQQVISAPWERLNLSPAAVQKISAAGIKTVILTSNRQGLFINVDDLLLPYLHWANGEVGQLVDLARQLDLLGAINENPNAEVLIETVQNLLPFVQTLEVKLVINFP